MVWDSWSSCLTACLLGYRCAPLALVYAALGWSTANWACQQDTTNQTTLPLPSFLLHFCVWGCIHIYVNTRMFLVWSSSENVLNYGFSVSLIGSSFLGFAFYYLNTFSMSDESCSHIIRLQGDLTCGIKTQSSSLWATKGSINIFKGASRPVLTETAPQFQIACCFLIIRFQLLIPVSVSQKWNCTALSGSSVEAHTIYCLSLSMLNQRPCPVAQAGPRLKLSSCLSLPSSWNHPSSLSIAALIIDEDSYLVNFSLWSHSFSLYS